MSENKKNQDATEQKPSAEVNSDIRVEKISDDAWIKDLQLDSSWLVAGMSDGGTNDSGSGSGSGSGDDDGSSSTPSSSGSSGK